MGIGRRIKEARENLGITQNELGELIGTTGSSVTNYEKETSHPKETILYKLIEVLQVDANYLFQDVAKLPNKMNDVTLAEYEQIKKYRDLDDHGKEMVDFTLEKEYERSIDKVTAKENIVKMPKHLEVIAAHERKDIEVTDEMRQNDDDIMDDDNF